MICQIFLINIIHAIYSLSDFYQLLSFQELASFIQVFSVYSQYSQHFLTILVMSVGSVVIATVFIHDASKLGPCYLGWYFLGLVLISQMTGKSQCLQDRGEIPRWSQPTLLSSWQKNSPKGLSPASVSPWGTELFLASLIGTSRSASGFDPSSFQMN